MARRDRHIVSLNASTPPSSIPASEMKPGEYAVITDDISSHQNGRIIGRTYRSTTELKYDNFFAVDNPKSTWSDPSFQVRVLAPGEKINIVVGGEE